MDKELRVLAFKARVVDNRLRLILRQLIKDNYSQRRNTTISLLLAIEKNMTAVFLLLGITVKGKHLGNYFKMPIGLLLRSCCINAITLSYLLSLDDASLEKEIKNRDYEYSGSMPDRLDVYRDQIRSVDEDMTDDLINHLYELGLEDWLSDGLHFEYNEKVHDLKASRPRGTLKREMGIEDGKKIADMCKAVKDKVPSLEAINSYYRYFSQYEHFSTRGFGDAFAKLDSDNIYLPGAIEAIEAWLDEESVKLHE